MKYEGQALSPGKTTGRAILIKQLDDLKQVQQDDIIITSFPSPLFNPFLLKASGLIVEEGGLLSHGAIIAREVGIPCIRIKKAPSIFTTGQTIRLDTETQTAEVL